ncbi:MAG: hypothetical protein R3A52_26700 [Polyangiales bacterium]
MNEENDVTWSRVPGDMPRVVGILASPSDPEVIYALPWSLDSTALILRSTDGGLHWHPLGTKPRPRMAVQSMAIASARPGTIVLGAYGAVFRTTDGGETWSASELPGPAAMVYALAVSSDGGRVYAGTLTRGLNRSDDGGVTWVRSPELLGVTSIALDPTNEARVYFARYVNAAPPLGGIFASTDAGEHWTHSAPFPHQPSKACHFVTFDAGGTAYALAQVYPVREERPGVWVELKLSPAEQISAGPIGVDPRRPGVLYVPTRGVYASIDRGEHWRLTGLADRDLRMVTVSPADPRVVYVSDGESLFRTDPAGGRSA